MSSIPTKRQTRWDSPATGGEFVAVGYFNNLSMKHRCGRAGFVVPSVSGELGRFGKTDVCAL